MKVKLGKLIKISGGKRLPKGVMLTSIPNSHPYITVKNLQDFKSQLDPSFEYVPEAIFPKIAHYTVSNGDLVLSIVGTIGRTSLIGDTLNGASLTENCAKLTPNSSLLKSYLYYFLISEEGRNQIQKGIVGSTQPKLPFYNISNIEISLPSIEQQQHIVDTIGTIDDLIENNEKIINLSFGRINDFYALIQGDKTTSRLGDFFDISIGRTPPTKENIWFSDNPLGSTPWLSIKDMDTRKVFALSTSQFLTNAAVAKFRIPLVEVGDVLLSFKLTVGRVMISAQRMVTNEAIACFKANDEYRNYLFCFLHQSNFLADGDNTSSIGRAVNSTIIKNFPFEIPERANLKEFNRKTEPLFSLVLSKRKENDMLQKEKTALLNQYFGLR
jgi:type I restriction enzyme S subunit